jgi:hypothetical protein
MIRRIDSGTLYHEVMKVASEPSITTKGGTFVVSNQRQITYREKLPKGKLVLVVSQATRRAKGPVTKTLSTSSDVTTEFYFSLLQKNPVEIMSTPQLRYLWVDNAFYEAESNLTFDQAVALVRESGLKRARKIQRAVEAAQASQLGTRVQREAISDAVKHHIWVRDEGRCVECEWVVATSLRIFNFYVRFVTDEKARTSLLIRCRDISLDRRFEYRMVLQQRLLR